MTRQATLANFLQGAFTDDELRRLPAEIPEGGGLSNQLSTRAAAADLAHATVDALERRGLIDDLFFDILKHQRPRRAAEIDRLRAEWMLPAKPEPSDGLQRSLLRLLLDRSKQWAELVRHCRNAQGDLYVLVHAGAEQDLGLFQQRVQAYFGEESRPKHAVHRVKFVEDHGRNQTDEEWLLATRRALAASTQATTTDTVAELCRGARDNALLLMLGEGPLYRLMADERAALAAFLGERLPESLTASRERAPDLIHRDRQRICVVIPVQRTHPVHADPLLADVRAAAARAQRPLLTCHDLPELDWPDLELDVLPQSAHLLEGSGGLTPNGAQRLRAAYTSARADPDCTYASLADALARVIDDLSRTPR